MQDDDGALAARARAGDVDAFARLVDRHRADALRLAYAIAGDDADDVTQEACIKAFRKLDTFRDDAPFRPWLLGIVANEARNARRSSGRRGALALRVANRVEPAGASPEELTVAIEARASLVAAVGRLGDRDREIVALRYFLGLSEAETATALRCATGTVKSRLSRALDRLRADLGNDLETGIVR